ncbi:TPA: MogA/MoaB family molybdenum cofactor biosynthesis protein [Listeria innocua]|uniref:MogA/MoaB family molybdenum cofactor biosynthesis protein n=1 Tax=Listeria innocua TaxID=1642 RepID=UPI000FB18A42|nr:molybdenum cofactor biosynthesis protein B [Listeria innocua]EAD5842372.1 molybdenum cofactor biosynthesis protein MoaB [Listeria innocua]EAG8541191.1 molybdenum cofactor biosynthesis protein MoaB [Listeria innocua]EDO1186146.1 molybdenum cofactor biosynthesis protein [Listeria innocua]EKY3974123.1 molybdenum cofactor biosynthesis protein MoaB [Listeria innocua]MBC1365583.1 molybdenum cofactor biosynthesis protein MoaB [Listeria innocua]
MKQKTFIKVTCSILTISDTRNLETDTSGKLIQSLLEAAGHQVITRVIVPDDAPRIKQEMDKLAVNGSFCLITNGGTGIAKRDVTYEALFATIQQEIPGFGEIFRMLSYEEVGSRAMVSRAFAGFSKSGLLIFALPGSSNASRLATEKLIIPELPHLIAERQK